MDTSIASYRLPLLIIAGLSVSLLIIGSAHADNNASHAASGITTPAERVTTAPAQQKQAGMEALQAIGKARELIAKQDLKGASIDVAQANTLLNSITDMLPTAQSRQMISDAKNNVMTDSDWVSIYDSLDQTAMFMPVKAAKSKVNAAQQASTQGNQDAARQSLDAALLDISYSEIDLPLNSTQNFVRQAAGALQQGDAKAADKALQSAELGVIYLSSAVEQPLYQARYSLWQALLSLKNDAVTDTKRHIDKALAYLQQAQKSADKTISDAANSLLTEGKALRADMDNSPTFGALQTNTDHLSQLETLGQHTEAWAERSLNYARSKWADLSSYSPLKIDLIESRFHLQNAIINQATEHDTAAAKNELEQTVKYLGKATLEANTYWTDPVYKQQINAVQNSLGRLINSPTEIPGAIDEGQLSNVMQELQMAITSL